MHEFLLFHCTLVCILVVCFDLILGICVHWKVQRSFQLPVMRAQDSEEVIPILILILIACDLFAEQVTLYTCFNIFKQTCCIHSEFLT
jgi:hypothetical protein